MTSSSPSPLRSLSIERTLLKDHETIRARPPSKKPCALITTKIHPTLPLSIHNYNNRAFMGSVLDELAVAARTLVTESTTGNVVSRSFSKFFNYDEKFAYRPVGNEYAFSVEEKIDGSIISLFYYRKEWILTSRTSFEGPHIQAAQSILDKQYPTVLSKLDTEKTYVFELIEPSMPVKILYTRRDLALLSIISKNGEEPPFNFQWNSLPFSRPRIHSTSTVNPKLLSKLNTDNEEGFVIKFWRSAEDRYPQRIKVKFESYLRAIAPPTSRQKLASLELSSTAVRSPPSNVNILDIYINHRLRIQHFKFDLVSSQMKQRKELYLQSLESISDDYGGEAWLKKVEKVWDRIDALLSMQEAEWLSDIASLRREGYKPNAANVNSKVAKQGFEKRVKRSYRVEAYRVALFSWFIGESSSKQVSLVLKSMVIPEDLRSTELVR